MVKKLNGFLIEKNSNFQNNKVKNFKYLEILQSKRFFSGNNFSYIHASRFKSSTYVLYWKYYRKIKNQIVIG